MRAEIGEIVSWDTGPHELRALRHLAITFEPPLSHGAVDAFVARHFERESDLRLWGNPLKMGRHGGYWHVYGLASYKMTLFDLRPDCFLLVATKEGDSYLRSLAERIVRSMADAEEG